MSLILEALKKSERQRRLGESPSIGSPVFAVRRRRSLLPIIIVLIVIALLVLWWVRRDTFEQAPAGSSTQTPQATTAPANAASKASITPAKAPDATTFNDVPLSARQPGQEIRQPRDAQTRSANAERSRKLRDGELVAANPSAGAAATIKESEPVSAADPVALAAAMAEAGTPAAKADKPTTRGKPDRGHAISTEKPATAPPPMPVNTLPTGLKLMWELPLATRQKLPEIKLSMHVFAKDPVQRFVIINGERHAQGDDIDGMKLVEIRADGVVFEYEGTRFLYPRGGR